MDKLTPEMITQLTERPFPFVERMGLKALELKPGLVRLMVPIAGNGNHIGSMYAGALFTLAEIPGGALFMTTFDVSMFYPVVKEMTIRFKRPVTTDAFIEMRINEIEAARIAKEAEKNGKSEFILEGQITDANNQVMAESRGVYQIRRYMEK
jgi:thioesterase domain-containing protein